MFDNSVLKKYLKIGFFLVSHEENNRDIFGWNSLPIKIIVFIYKYSIELLYIVNCVLCAEMMYKILIKYNV